MKKEYRNSTRTKKMIRSAFVDLIEEKKLLNSITVAELAERADIAKSTFYNHYDDVYSVADEIMQELMEELDEIIDAMEADNTKDYRIYISRIFSFIKENQNIYSKVASSPDAVFFIDRIKRVVSDRVISKINSPHLSKNKSLRHVQVNFISNACVDTLVDYFRGNINMSLDDLEKNIIQLLAKFL